MKKFKSNWFEWLYGNPTIDSLNAKARSSFTSLILQLLVYHYCPTTFFYSKQRWAQHQEFDITANFCFFLILIFFMTFHSFKNVKIVGVNLKAHSFPLYKDGTKLNHFAFWQGFHCHFHYVDYNFSDIIPTSIRIMNCICHFLMPCSYSTEVLSKYNQMLIIGD